MFLDGVLANPLTRSLLKLGAEMAMPPEAYNVVFRGYTGHYGSDTADNPARLAALEEVKRKDGSVSVLIGTRETGKSLMAQREAEFFGRDVYAVSPEQAPPSWIHRVQLKDIAKLPHRITLIVEDMPAQMGNRDYNDELVHQIETLIPMCRHEKKVHFIFITQSSAQADKYILDCDLAFFKPQGILMGDVERPGIKKIYDKYVNPYFEGQSQDWMHKHAFMVSRTYLGGISISRVPDKQEVITTAPNAQGIYEAKGTEMVDIRKPGDIDVECEDSEEDGDE
jgi:hypothetical protein